MARHRVLVPMRGGIALAMLALVATVPSAPFSAADAPSGVLQRHDFSEGADGWTAVSGAATAGPFGVLEVLVVDGRARSPALPTELPIRVVANVLPPASPYSGALDVVDASGVRLARFYTFAAGCYVQVASGSPVRVPGCWSTGWMRVEFELASDGYSLRLDGLAPVTGAYLAAGAPSAIEASAASLGRPIRLDVVRVDRGPRVDDGLVESASFAAFERVDSRPEDGGFDHADDSGFTDRGRVEVADEWPRLPQQEFASLPAPPGAFVVQTAFGLGNSLFVPDGAAVVAGLPAGVGTAPPLWAVTVEQGVGSVARLAFVRADGTSTDLAPLPTADWHAVLAHADPATGRLRVFFDETLVLDEPAAHPGRVAMGDVFDGLVPLAERTGSDYRLLLDGGVPLALADAAAAP